MLRVLSIALILSGCASRLTHYPRPMDISRAQSIVEQVAMEQPQKHRPEGVVFTDEFIGLSVGTLNRRKGNALAIPVGNMAIASGGSAGLAKDVNTRLYYSSIGETRIHTKRDWYILDVMNTDGERMQRIFARNETKAKAFVDAIAALKAAGDGR